MNILLSNDDGYDQKGILALKEALKKYGDIYISAPLKQKSGSSCSITFCGKESIHIIDDKTIAVDGTPVDSIINGLQYFKNIKFDYVFSGVNNGFNESIAILFSGTIGAAITACFMGLKVIALSCSPFETFETIKNKTEYIVDYIFNKKIMDKTRFINVNYPTPKYEARRDVKLGKIYYYSFSEFPMDYFDKEDAYIEYEKKGYPLDFDAYLTNKGYYTITPLKTSLEDTDKINELKELL